MKNLTYATRIFLISLLLVITGSCEKFFDPEIETLLSEEDSYSDQLSSRASVNGLYAQLQDLMTSYVVLGELRADMLQVSPAADQELKDIYNLQYGKDNRFFPGRSAYKIISNCNDVIYHLEKLKDKGTTYDKQLFNMHAEAVILRSWTYFYLLRTFGEVPYIVNSYAASGSQADFDVWLTSNSGNNVETDMLIDDVKAVISNLDPENIAESEFFNTASAYALLGEMYLWEDNYQQAVDALFSSIAKGAGSRFILDKDLENSKWANIFKGDESATDEIMTKTIFDKGEKQENELLDIFSAISANGKELVPTIPALTAFDGSQRFAGTYKNNDEVGKYTRSLDAPYTSDMPVILYRAADVHLMLAEGLNRLGNVDDALQLLNNGSDSLFTAGSKGIRGRVGLPSLKVSGTDMADSIQNMEDLIIKERSLELAFEGKRWFDILRIARRRNDAGYLSNMVMKRFDTPDSSAVTNFYNDAVNWYLPFE